MSPHSKAPIPGGADKLKAWAWLALLALGGMTFLWYVGVGMYTTLITYAILTALAVVVIQAS